MELFMSTCPLGLHKYACQLPFSCLGYFPSGIDKNNSISCFLENRKWKYYFHHVPWDYKNMLDKFCFYVLAIFLQNIIIMNTLPDPFIKTTVCHIVLVSHCHIAIFHIFTLSHFQIVTLSRC